MAFLASQKRKNGDQPRKSGEELKSAINTNNITSFLCLSIDNHAELLNGEDLEDGEIFEDEAAADSKSVTHPSQEKVKAVETEAPAMPVAQKKPEPVKNDKVFETNEKPVREQQNVPFFNRAKRKHFDEHDEDARWKRDVVKRNRRSNEFDGDCGRSRIDGEVGDDDEEMMFVRGASPHRLDEDMDKWDRDRDDEDDDREIQSRRPSRPYRGRGNMSRRGDQRLRGRGRGRGCNMRTGKRKREDNEMCVFFLQGKCHRGTECPYAHEILPPRKPELCKFYMKDCCAKKDKCLYMHSEFPCKYFHQGLKCYANKKCKFNHSILTDQLRNILAKHIDASPKDFMGEYLRRDQRDSRERDGRDMRDVRDMRDQRDSRDFGRKNDRERKIPSLFDIKVTIPEDMRNTEGNHTPMPSPQRSQDSQRSSDRDRDNHSSERERDRERDREKEREREREHERRKHEKSERRAKKERAREHRKERKERKEKERERKRERSKDALSDKNDSMEQDDKKNLDISSLQAGDNRSTELFSAEKMSEDQERKGLGVEENGLIPTHLPKKQRELFLRIQQQQREAENSQASANDDDDDDDKIPEENWYSSDEEVSPSTSLPSILQNLTQGTSAFSTTTTTTVATAVVPTSTTSSVMPLLNLLATATASVKPSGSTTTIPTATPFIPPNLDLSNLSTVFEALSNLQRITSSTNKPAEQEQSPKTLNKPEIPPEVPKPPEPPKPEPARVRDPRLARGDPGFIDIHRSSVEGRRGSKEDHFSDVDLRPKSSVKSHPSNSDVDLRNLPFKPVQHSAASEIDASLSSHSPIPWQLIPAECVKADYTTLQIQPRPGVNDPRLRRVVRPPTDELGIPRDPRQRLMDEPPIQPQPPPVRDPRQVRQPLLATPLIPPSPLLSGPPPTPRYDEDHRSQFYHMDSDMRQFPPPTPRLEDDVYTPGPSRPVDPRQRNVPFHEDPRRKQFPGRPDDVDLRPPITHRLPYM